MILNTYNVVLLQTPETVITDIDGVLISSSTNTRHNCLLCVNNV